MITRWPALRHLRVGTTARTIDLRELASAKLDSFSIRGDKLRSIEGLASVLARDLGIATRLVPRITAPFRADVQDTLRIELPRLPEWIALLPPVRDLTLRIGSVNDAQMATALSHLAAAELESLSLRGSPVTAAILSSLERFPALRSLDLAETKVGVNAVERFAASRPSLRHFPRRIAKP